MNQGTILHLCGWDKKFIPPFIDLIHTHFSDGRHKFIVYGLMDRAQLPQSSDIKVYGSLLKNIFALSKAMHQAEKIILHGLFNNHLLYILALQPWLLKKCHWVIWGGDLYVHQSPLKDWRLKKNELFRNIVIKHLGYLLTYVPGDVVLARQWYGATGQYQECLMYTSNIFKQIAIASKTGSEINILVGNSADATNNHLDVFEKLAAFKSESMMIYCPLSYGQRNDGYAKLVAEKGAAMFGAKFVAMTDFMPYLEYLKFLGQIDIAIFAHKRQQGMGNTITLLGLGKKVYMRSDVTPWTLFSLLGIAVFDVEKIDINPLSSNKKEENKKIISDYFSKKNLIEHLEGIFQ